MERRAPCQILTNVFRRRAAASFYNARGWDLARSGLAGLLGNSANGSVANRQQFPGKAKRVIHFFLNGGPSHVDTFDPKPALAKYAGQPLPETLTTERKTGAAFPSPFKFKKYGQSGIEVSELFARTAEHIDDIAVIRSMFAQVPNHEPSLMLMNCGDSVQPRPSVGAWVLYGLGTENQNLPGFIAMCPGGYPVKDAENWQSGFLPGAYQGTFIDPQYEQIDRLIENIRSPHATATTQRRQLDLLQTLNAEHRDARHDGRLDARIQSFELAFRMQIEAAEAFDVTREPQHIRELYGDGVHGRQTLIARRLLERGVRYVQLWHGAGQPWDSSRTTSKRITASLAQRDRSADRRAAHRPEAAGHARRHAGHLGRRIRPHADGRTRRRRQIAARPRPQPLRLQRVAGRRRHHAAARSTARPTNSASRPSRQPTSVHDLHATILHLLGFDHERLTYRYAGRDFRLTDVHGKVVREIVA